MGKIKRLAPEVVEKIAAGEVVERPAAIVKELIENSLDAGATAIRVDVQDGGAAMLAVADDGCGMTPEDARLAVERHATSKIRGAEDLFRVSTLGFRGEALAAMAAVSRLTLTTKPDDDRVLEGTRLVVEGGRNLEEVSCGAPAGTTVRIERLFFNTPARLKFLKSAHVEYGHIADVVSSFALLHPDVRWELIRDGKRHLSYVPAADPRVRIGEVFGKGVSLSGLIEVREEGAGISLQGFVRNHPFDQPTPNFPSALRDRPPA